MTVPMMAAVFFLEVKPVPVRKLKKYKPTKFMAKDSRYNKDAADFAVMFIESLCHTKGTWAGQPFELIDWQEQIIRDLFGMEAFNNDLVIRYLDRVVVKDDGYEVIFKAGVSVEVEI